MPIAGAVHRGDQRLAGSRSALQEAKHRRVFAAAAALEKILQVVAGGEAVGRAVDQHHAHRGVRFGRRNRVGNRAYMSG